MTGYREASFSGFTGSEGQGQFTEGFTLGWSGLKGLCTQTQEQILIQLLSGESSSVPFQGSRVSQRGLLVPAFG